MSTKSTLIRFSSASPFFLPLFLIWLMDRQIAPDATDRYRPWAWGVTRKRVWFVTLTPIHRRQASSKHYIIMPLSLLHGIIPTFMNTVMPQDARPQAAQTLQVHIFELGPKKFEMNEFMKWKPWAAQFSDHLAFTLLSNKSCTNFELHEFFLSPKNVHLKALLYLNS